MRQFKHKKDKYLNKDISIEKFTVEYNKFNLEDFKNALKSSTVMEKTYHKAKEKYPMWPEIHQDIWDALFKYDPYLFDENTVDTRYALNRGVMEAVMKSEHYKELRQLTRLDLLGTTMGTESLSEDVQKLIEDLKEQFEEALAEFEAAEEALKQMEGDGDSNQKGAGEGQEDDEDENDGKKHGKPNDNKKWSLEEAQKRLEEARNKLNTVVDKKAAGKINRFVNAAIVKTKEVTDMISAWGLEQSDTFVKSGFQEKMKMLDRLRNNPKLKRIADLAGRYKRHAVALQKQKIKFGTDSIHNVITGDDIGRILPSEAMKLKNRLWNKLFKKSLLEKTVLQYEYRGKEKIAKGAIVCCVDSSGSMDGAPEVWSKSVALAMVEIAKIQKRDVYVIHFDSSPKNALHTNYFPKDGNYGIEEILDMCEYFARGGTLFEPPLERAQDEIMKQKQFSKADIIFVTDGESAVGDKWVKEYNKWKTENKVNVYTILINVSRGTTVTTDLFSNRTYYLSDFNESKMDNTAFDLFSSI